MPATEARTEFSLAETRWAVDEDSSIKTRRPLAREVDVVAYFDSEVAAADEAARQQDLLGADRDIYVALFPIAAAPDYAIGDTVTVTDARGRFGLNVGKNLVVVGITDDAAAGQKGYSLWG